MTITTKKQIWPKQVSAFDQASFFERMTYSWIKPFWKRAAAAGDKEEEFIMPDEMGRPSKEDNYEQGLAALSAQYERESKRYDDLEAVSDSWRNPIMHACLKGFMPQLIGMMSITFVITSMDFISPLITKWTIDYIREPGAEPGLTHAAMLILALSAVNSVFMHFLHSQNHSHQCAQRRQMISSVNTLIYDKVNKVSRAASASSLQDSKIDELVHRGPRGIHQLIGMCHRSVRQVVNIVGLSWFFVSTFGWVSVFIVVCYAAIIVMQRSMHKNDKTLHEKIREERGNKHHQVYELLTHIKFLKLYGWDRLFLNRINDTKDRLADLEREEMAKSRLLHAAINILERMVPIMAFSAMIYFNKGIDLGIIILAQNHFGRIQHTLREFPQMQEEYTRVIETFHKVQKFFGLPDVQKGIQTQQASSAEYALEVKGNFSWGFAERGNADSKDEAKAIDQYLDLKEIDFKIKKGQFVCIVGDVGCGKTSLLEAVNQEMLFVDQKFINQAKADQTAGELKQEYFNELLKEVCKKEITASPVKVQGTTSIVQQKPWIQNKTIREIILFGKPMDEAFYIATIKACQLAADLKDLPASDLTEIGDRGINLSGGQKARISLARAVYARCDVMLMDDPISALDANVRKRIFTQVFKGLCRDKTRVLVTHAIDFLHLSDAVCIMQKGEIKAFGTYQELLSNSHFQEILAAHYDQRDETIVKAQVTQVQEVETEKEEIDFKFLEEEEARKNGQLTKKEEEIEENEADVSTFYKMLKYMGGLKSFVIPLVMIAIQKIVSFFNERSVQTWGVQAEDMQKENFSKNLIFAASLSFLDSMLGTGFDIFNHKQRQSNQTGLFSMLMDKLTHAPVNLYYDVTPVDRITEVVHSDVSNVQEGLMDRSQHLIWCVYEVVLIVYLTMTSLPSLMILLVLQALKSMFGGHEVQFKANQKQMWRLMRAVRFPHEQAKRALLQGGSVMRCFGLQKQYFDEIKAKQNDVNKLEMMEMTMHQYNGFSKHFFTIATEIMTLSICMYNRGGIVDAVLLVDLINKVQYFHHNIGELTWIKRDFLEKLKSVDKVLEFENLIQEVDEGTQEVSESWPQKGEIEFKNLSLRYRPQTDLVLKNVSFKVEPGQKCGIVGRTGSGKSTTALTLSRVIQPEEGSIEIDGVDISKVPLKHLRSKVTVIPQDPTLFKGTLQFNIDPLKTHSPEQVLEIIDKAGLPKLLAKQNKGQSLLDFEIQAGGGNLSAGEQQLICICRAILRKNKIVIMDEATANIDVLTEQTQLDLLSQELKGSTVLTIAHRLNTVIKSDLITVMDFGRVKELGSPNKLSQNPNSEFYKLLQELHKSD